MSLVRRLADHTGRQSPRTFLAIPLPRQLKEAISAVQSHIQAQITGVRWIRSENLHLTLHFFGETKQEDLEKIRVSVLSVKQCQQPFLVEVKRLGAFPNLHRPRTLWLDLEPKDQLRKLHGDLRRCLHQVGIATESRPYSPHLTIGRLRQQKSDLTDLYNSVGQTLVGRLPVDKLVLFESRLHPGGAEHIPLLTVNFDDEISKL
jgi:2'-5' RNA ligase